jgi:hypothetical protein
VQPGLRQRIQQGLPLFGPARFVFFVWPSGAQVPDDQHLFATLFCQQSFGNAGRTLQQLEFVVHGFGHKRHTRAKLTGQILANLLVCTLRPAFKNETDGHALNPDKLPMV